MIVAQLGLGMGLVFRGPENYYLYIRLSSLQLCPYIV